MQEDIFKGATRPATLFGAPLIPVVSNIGIAMLATMWGGMMFSFGIAPFVVGGAIFGHCWMRMVTKKDDQRLHQLMLKLKLSFGQRNRRFWRARSYAPINWRGTSDGNRKR
jgi:type IV secretion system protein VirB3